MDVFADTYTNKHSQIYSTLKEYINNMIDFAGDSRLGQKIEPDNTTSIMEIGIPKSSTKEQTKQIMRAVQYAKGNLIIMNVRVIQ